MVADDGDTTAAELYRVAQQSHFAKRFAEAWDGYHEVTRRFPSSKEADRAQQQIENLRPLVAPGTPVERSGTSGNIRPSAEMPSAARVCPHCAEVIRAAANKCRYCGEWLDGSTPPASNGSGAAVTESSGGRRALEDVGSSGALRARSAGVRGATASRGH